MSRYKDYRGTKRRDYDEDYITDYQGAGRQPEYFSPRPSPTQGSEPVEATVKWFNADKGFGFIIVTGGPDAFLSARALELAGHSGVPDGARVKVRISQGQKGPQVSEVLEVDTTTAQVTERRPASRPTSRRPGAGPTEEWLGSVKWYNVEKGFGFVAADRGGKDVFVHATTLDARSERVERVAGRSAGADANKSGAERAGGPINRTPGLTRSFGALTARRPQQ